MRINFDTARDVLLAFPTLGDDVETTPDAREPLAFTRDLIDSETPEDCISWRTRHAFRTRPGSFGGMTCQMTSRPSPDAR